MQLLQHAEGPQGPQGPQGGRDAQPAAGPLDELNLRHIDVQKDDARFANHPWMGVTCRQEWGHHQTCVIAKFLIEWGHAFIGPVVPGSAK